jgi:hypothetical protein
LIYGFGLPALTLRALALSLYIQDNWEARNITVLPKKSAFANETLEKAKTLQFVANVFRASPGAEGLYLRFHMT